MKAGRVAQGALVVLGEDKQVQTTIVFQYDPGTVTRTLTPKLVEGDRGSPAPRDPQPPEEQIELKVELNASDQPVQGRQQGEGLLPTLAILEALAYPALADVARAETARAGDLVAHGDGSGPLLLVLGQGHATPVALARIVVTETGFDAALVPITADVQLNFEVVRSSPVSWDGTRAGVISGRRSFLRQGQTQMTERRAFYGKHRGEVVDDRDPDKLGRVKVKVPAVLADLDAWAMPCMPYAGKGVGWFVIPPVGAKVWVEFEGGDPDFPIWTGCFWDAAADLPGADAEGRGNPDVYALRVPGVEVEARSGSVRLTVGGSMIEVSDGTVTARTGASSAVLDANGVSLERGGVKIELTDAGINSTAGSTRIAQTVGSLALQNGAAEVALTPASVNINKGALEVI